MAILPLIGPETGARLSAATISTARRIARGSALILARMAANLVNTYRRADDRRGLRWSARLRARCPGVAPEELAQLGDLLARTGAWDEAAATLDAAAEAGGDERWSRRADAHRARLN